MRDEPIKQNKYTHHLDPRHHCQVGDYVHDVEEEQDGGGPEARHGDEAQEVGAGVVDKERGHGTDEEQEGQCLGKGFCLPGHL